MMAKHIFILFIFAFMPFYSLGNNDTCIKINEAKWEKIVKDKNFIESYDEPEEKKDKPSNINISNTSVDFGGFKYVFYFLIGGAILFLIVKLLLNLNNPPVIVNDANRVYTLQEVEEKAMEIDLDKVLNDALKDGNFKMALRINFLIIIKQLSLKGMVVWTKEKTNWEYFNEIKDKATANGFKEIVELFEIIWYGEYELTEQRFNRLLPLFETFKKKLA